MASKKNIVLCNELIEAPDEEGAYYKVDIVVGSDGMYSCTIPDLGKCVVAKEMPRYSYLGEPFAWKITGRQ